MRMLWAAQPRNVPAPQRNFDHGMTMAEMARQDMKREENRAIAYRECKRPAVSKNTLRNQVLRAVTDEPKTSRKIAEEVKRPGEIVSSLLVSLRNQGWIEGIKGRPHRWVRK